MRTYLSNRDMPLLYVGDQPQVPVLTVENYCKWYKLFLVHPDGSVEPVPFPMDCEQTGGTGFVDHVPHPRAFVEEAHRRDAMPHAAALEMITGRWVLEVRDDDWARDINEDPEP